MELQDQMRENNPTTRDSERGKFDLLYKILKVSDETVKTTNRLEEAVDRIGKIFTVDCHAPASIAEKAEAAGMTKTGNKTLRTILLGILAGMFISFGAIFATVVTTNSGLGFGMAKLIGGLVFCLGLILVVIAGAELFTGNNLIVMAWLSKKVKFTGLLKNWGIVYIANFVGSIAIVGLVFASEQWTGSGYGIGVNALNIANAKVNLSFSAALVKGILANALVCLAVWLTFSARTVVDKIMAIVFPITAFVAAGFEHSIANMYFIPMGMLMAKQTAVLSAAGLTAESVSNLTWAGFFGNLIPVTIGNIIGGIAVGIVYWFAYLRKQKAVESTDSKSWLASILSNKQDENPGEAITMASSSANISIEEMIRAKLEETDTGNVETIARLAVLAGAKNETAKQKVMSEKSFEAHGDSEVVPAS